MNGEAIYAVGVRGNEIEERNKSLWSLLSNGYKYKYRFR